MRADGLPSSETSIKVYQRDDQLLWMLFFIVENRMPSSTMKNLLIWFALPTRDAACRFAKKPDAATALAVRYSRGKVVW